MYYISVSNIAGMCYIKQHGDYFTNIIIILKCYVQIYELSQLAQSRNQGRYLILILWQLLPKVRSYSTAI